MTSSSSSRVCVTGASGYIATCLIKKLLQRGCVVHATLRNLGDEKKTAPLKELPGAVERLVLFEADMYDADTFEPAIAGCEFVFLLATPLHHDPRSTKYKNTTEAAVDAMRIILQQCERSKTVRRVIHTASVTATSPLREDGGEGYKDFINESCWTPLDHSHSYNNTMVDVLSPFHNVSHSNISHIHVNVNESIHITSI
uniref:NAD-dependent epimerase/dehydratase domain-containing protein n=1 Tax=Oryza glaberrima TaxID=4538 RepID=I1QC00_ORYGL